MVTLGLILWNTAGGQTEEQNTPVRETRTAYISTVAEDAQGYYDQGQREAAQGRWEEAVTLYQKAVEIDPGYVAAHKALGRTYREHYQWEKALASYSQIVAIDPDYVEAYYYRAASHLALRHYAEAVADFSRVISTRPHYSHAYFGRGVAHWLMGRCPEAVQNLEAFIALSPEEAIMARARGYVDSLEVVAECLNPPPDVREVPGWSLVPATESREPTAQES